MKAVCIHEFGGAEVLRVEDLPRPTPGPGELLIEVRAASVNPVDYKTREGRYPAVRAEQLPVVLGRDVAGVVAGLGEGVSRFSVGDEVFAMLPPDRGGYVEWVTAPAEVCARKPRRLDLIQAASAPLAALSAWPGAFTYGRLVAGQKVLIHGASGGVRGRLRCSSSALKRLEVYATAAGDARELLESLGADRVIDYHTEAFEEIVSDVDLVYDLIGGATERRSWQVLKRGGCFVSTVHEPDADKVLEAGVMACRYTARADGDQLRKIAALIDSGQVSVIIDRVFPLEEAAEAERHLENDHVTGKVVLEVG